MDSNEIMVRELKIESTGDFYKGQVKPKIRISGIWLEKAGFKPGGRVSLKCVAPGIIEMHATETTTRGEVGTDQTVSTYT